MFLLPKSAILTDELLHKIATVQKSPQCFWHYSPFRPLLEEWHPEKKTKNLILCLFVFLSFMRWKSESPSKMVMTWERCSQGDHLYTMRSAGQALLHASFLGGIPDLHPSKLSQHRSVWKQSFPLFTNARKSIHFKKQNLSESSCLLIERINKTSSYTFWPKKDTGWSVNSPCWIRWLREIIAITNWFPTQLCTIWSCLCLNEIVTLSGWPRHLQIFLIFINRFCQYLSLLKLIFFFQFVILSSTFVVQNFFHILEFSSFCN